MRKFNPPNILKSKIGSGGIPQHLIDRAEDLIKEGDTGFEEYVTEQLDKLGAALKALEDGQDFNEDEQYNLVVPIMTLKAHGSMFGYNLISNISLEVLHLIEHIEHFNADVHEIINVYQKTTHAIIDKGLKADGGAVGKSLVAELNAACERFFSKYS